MADQIQKLERRVYSQRAEVTSYIYNKNRRFPVDAGTKTVNILVPFRGPERYRATLQSRAVTIAIQEWENRWGIFPWDLSQIVIHHFTIQVLIEVRVAPR